MAAHELSELPRPAGVLGLDVINEGRGAPLAGTRSMTVEAPTSAPRLYQQRPAASTAEVSAAPSHEGLGQ
jgi:hypothetical protein